MHTSRSRLIIILLLPRVSPLVVVPEKDGKIRITADYQRLNRVIVFATVIGRVPTSRDDENFDSVGEEKAFNTFDLGLVLSRNTVHLYTLPLTAFYSSSGLDE